MVHLIIESGLFKEITTEISENYIYNVRYRKKIKKFLARAATIEPWYQKFLRNEITKEDYFNAAKQHLKIK